MALSEVVNRKKKDVWCNQDLDLILVAKNPLPGDNEEIFSCLSAWNYLDRCWESKYKLPGTHITYMYDEGVSNLDYSAFAYMHLLEILKYYFDNGKLKNDRACIAFIGQEAFDLFKKDREACTPSSLCEVYINENYKFITVNSQLFKENIHLSYTVLPDISDESSSVKELLDNLNPYNLDLKIDEKNYCTLNDFLNRLHALCEDGKSLECPYFTLDGKCQPLQDGSGKWRIDWIMIDDLKYNAPLYFDPNPYFKDPKNKALFFNAMQYTFANTHIECKNQTLANLFGKHEEPTADMLKYKLQYVVYCVKFKQGLNKFEIYDSVENKVLNIKADEDVNTPYSEWYDKWLEKCKGKFTTRNEREKVLYKGRKQEWVFDIETFDKDWLVVAKTLDKRYRMICWNDWENLKKWISGKILIGFNNGGYDNALVKRYMSVAPGLRRRQESLEEKGYSQYAIQQELLKYPNIKESSDAMINGEDIMDVAEITGLDVAYFLSWDISFHMPFDLRRNSLKKLTMSVLNRRNYDSSVSFNTKGELSMEQRADVEKYCEMDVDNTMDLFLPDPNNPKRTFAKESYDIRWNMIVEYGMNCKTLINKAASFAGKLLCGEDAKPDTHNTSRKFYIDEDGHRIMDEKKGTDYEFYHIPELAEKELAGTEVLEFYHKHQKNPNYITEKLEVYLDGIEDESHKCQFGFGGLHQALVNYRGTDLVNMDVASLYPSLLVHYDLMSRGANKRPGSYKEVYYKRLDAKAKSKTDPKYKLLNEGLKLILNGSIGAFLSNFNPLYDTWSNSSICVHGQLLMYILVLRLKKAGFKIVQINTDGICVEKRDDVNYEEITEQWVKDTKLVLEYDDIKILQQNNVNNYYCEFSNGKVKSKGFYLSNEKFGKATSKILCNLVTEKPLLEGCEPRDFVIFKKHAISEIYDGETRTKVDGRSLAFVVGYENDPRTKTYYSRTKKEREVIKKDENGKEIIDPITGQKVVEKIHTESKITGFKDNCMLLVDDMNELKMEEIDTSAYIAFARNLLDVPEDFGPYFNENYKKVEEPDVYQALNAFKDNTILNPTNQNCFCQNLLYECDDMSKEEQEEMINRVKDKLYRVVWSGNKSYHIVVRLPQPVTSTLYKVLWYAIRNELRLIGADEQSALQSKYTRTPGQNNPKTGCEQTLYAYDKNIFDPTSLMDDLPKLKSEAKPVKEFTGELTINALQKHINKLDWSEGNRFAACQKLSPVLISQVDDEELQKMIPCTLEKDHLQVIKAKRRYFERNKEELLSKIKPAKQKKTEKVVTEINLKTTTETTYSY